MTQIQLAHTIYRRSAGLVPAVSLRNRYFEQNPVLNSGQDFTSLFARPRMAKYSEAGTGHVRFVFSEPGVFGDDAFVVSGLKLYRVSKSGAITDLGTISTDVLGGVSMAATGTIGDIPAYLYVADGGVLWVYTEDGSAIGHLQASGAIANNDVVQIGGIYYKFTNGSVDTGTPAGTSGAPWRVAFSGVNATDLQSLFDAINATGTAGTTYSTALTAHTAVAANVVTTADLYIVALDHGSGGNSISTTETGANLAWSHTTLTGGGASQLRQVGVPDDVGAISVAQFNSYVIVVPVQNEGVNGRFYWINPGEVTIDPLDFATAERSPDAINDVLALSDRFWLLGQKSTEAWISTGDPSAPMQRMTGILYEQGEVQGTAVRLGNSIVLVGENGEVLEIAGGIKVVSRPDIAQLVREGIQYSKQFS